MIITSFFKSKEYEGPKVSSAVYQPKGYTYPKIDWMDIRQADGSWIRPREFLDFPVPSQAYRDALWKHYLARERDIVEWVKQANPETVICCWCPYDKAAQRQLKQFGSFICHTSVIGLFLEARHRVKIEYDKDRERMLKYGLAL